MSRGFADGKVIFESIAKPILRLNVKCNLKFKFGSLEIDLVVSNDSSGLKAAP
jgi:hypothetical protein